MMCSEGDAASVCLGGTSRVIEVPRVEDCLQPVINIVPLQVMLLFLIYFLSHLYSFIEVGLNASTLSFTFVLELVL